jgi:hypothetical protein
MRRPNKIEISLVSSVLVLMLMLAALAGKVSALKKALVEKSVAEAVAVTNPAPFTAVAATNPAPVAVAVAVTNPIPAVAEPAVEVELTTNQTMLLKFLVVISNSVPSVVLEAPAEYLLSLEGFEDPFPVETDVLSDTNFFFNITYEVNGEKGICNYKLFKTGGKWWGGEWSQSNPHNEGECFAQEIGDGCWSAFFRSGVDGTWSTFTLEKRKRD